MRPASQSARDTTDVIGAEEAERGGTCSTLDEGSVSDGSANCFRSAIPLSSI